MPQRDRIFLSGLLVYYTEGFTHYYNDLALKMKFTGVLLIDQGYDILEFYVTHDNFFTFEEKQSIEKLFLERGLISDPSALEDYFRSDGSLIHDKIIEFVKNSSSTVKKLEFDKNYLVSTTTLKFNEVFVERDKILRNYGTKKPES